MNTLRTFTIGTFVFEYFNKTISRNVPNIPLLLNDTILQKGAMFSAKQSSDPCILAKSAELACAVLLPLVSALDA